MAKIALLIGVSEYGEGILPLSSPLNDVEAMERVLQNPNLGTFEQVERLLNPDELNPFQTANLLKSQLIATLFCLRLLK
jgi:Caspase domain